MGCLFVDANFEQSTVTVQLSARTAPIHEHAISVASTMSSQGLSVAPRGATEHTRLLSKEKRGALSPRSGSHARRREAAQARVGGAAQSVLAVLLATLVTVIDNLPYGFLLAPVPGALGTKMVLAAAAVSQASLAMYSRLPCALGCSIVENTPFLASMGQSIAAAAVPEKVLPTILFTYSLSSALTGATMALLGYLRLGALTQLFPKHALLGCVGGMGGFLVSAGLTVASGGAPLAFGSWSGGAAKVAVIVVLEAGLHVALHRTRGHPLTTPLYFCCVPCVFFAIVALTGHTAADAHEGDWMLSSGAADPADHRHWPVSGWLAVGACSFALRGGAGPKALERPEKRASPASKRASLRPLPRRRPPPPRHPRTPLTPRP